MLSPTDNPTNSQAPDVSGSGAGVKIGLEVSGQAPSAGRHQKNFRVAPGPADGASSDTNPECYQQQTFLPILKFQMSL
jgi:hypothetical protein